MSGVGPQLLKFPILSFQLAFSVTRRDAAPTVSFPRPAGEGQGEGWLNPRSLCRVLVHNCSNFQFSRFQLARLIDAAGRRAYVGREIAE